MKRQRRTAEDAREAALDAAQALLRASGPQALTLKAIAADAGTTHANLLHHFGSAAELQDALMARMIRDAEARVQAAVERMRIGAGGARDIVDAAFDAFSAGGIGRLAAWLHATGDTARLRPLFGALGGLVRGIEAGALLPPADAHRRIVDMTLLLTLLGLGDALAGEQVHASLDERRARLREVATEILLGKIERVVP